MSTHAAVSHLEAGHDAAQASLASCIPRDDSAIITSADQLPAAGTQGESTHRLWKVRGGLL